MVIHVTADQVDSKVARYTKHSITIQNQIVEAVNVAKKYTHSQLSLHPLVLSTFRASSISPYFSVHGPLNPLKLPKPPAVHAQNNTLHAATLTYVCRIAPLHRIHPTINSNRNFHSLHRTLNLTMARIQYELDDAFRGAR